jgi:hypothetical protein
MVPALQNYTTGVVHCFSFWLVQGNLAKEEPLHRSWNCNGKLQRMECMIMEFALKAATHILDQYEFVTTAVYIDAIGFVHINTAKVRKDKDHSFANRIFRNGQHYTTIGTNTQPIF